MVVGAFGVRHFRHVVFLSFVGLSRASQGRVGLLRVSNPAAGIPASLSSLIHGAPKEVTHFKFLNQFAPVIFINP